MKCYTNRRRNLINRKDTFRRCWKTNWRNLLRLRASDIIYNYCWVRTINIATRISNFNRKFHRIGYWYKRCKFYPRELGWTHTINPRRINILQISWFLSNRACCARHRWRPYHKAILNRYIDCRAWLWAVIVAYMWCLRKWCPWN